MPSRAFFKLAPRLAAYQGVIRAVVAGELATGQPGGSVAVNGQPAQRSADPVDRAGVVVADTATLLSHPAFRPMPGEAPVVAVTGGGGDAPGL